MTRRRRRTAPASTVPVATPAAAPRRWRAPATVVAGVAVFCTLTVVGYWNTSATWDEPIHLTAGYAALRAGDFRVDPSHPPLLRMWAALPLLGLAPIRLETAAIDRAPSPAAWLTQAYAFAHQFMYVDNDADRMLRAARGMIVLLALALGVMVFCWTYEWLGLRPAIVALALFVIEPNLVAHASLVTTDLGITTFLFGAVYFLWRTCRRPTPLNIAAVALFCGLALASKFSAVLLAPILVLLLAAAVRSRTLTPRTAAAIATTVAFVSVATIWASYGFRYLPSGTPAWSFDFARTDMAAGAPWLAAAVGWIDDHHLLPNAYSQGFLYSQVSVQQLPSFLAGNYSANGWWYYFPVAFLIKTPVALIVLLALGVVAGVVARRPRTATPILFVALPAAVFLGAAMYSRINIGLRHILPIYPFVLLIAASAAAWLMTARTRLGPAVLAVLLIAGGAEFASAYPHTLPFFNQFVGGPANGFRYLADSNLGWGQNLKPLKAWMDDNGVSHINLAYFGQADPAYYHINCTQLPGAPEFAIDSIARPRLPGYVAISPTIQHGVYAPPHWRLWYQPFETLTPAAVIGNSLRVYWVEEWPEAIGPAGHTPSPDAHRVLADALLFGMRWPEPAVLHYREHLQSRPGDAEALLNLGIAIALTGDGAGAIPPLRASVAARPDHGGARLTLARTLFASRDLAGAAQQAEHAVRLLPADADARDFLGRVRAAQGRFADADRAFRDALALDPSHAEARQHLSRLSGGQ